MCTIAAPESAPPGLYFGAKDYDHYGKPDNGHSPADVISVRRSHLVSDAFVKLDRLRGALKQLRYMDETGHIEAVLPHLRERIREVSAQLEAVLADVDQAVCRNQSPEVTVEDAPPPAVRADPETLDELREAIDAHPSVGTSPSPVDVGRLLDANRRGIFTEPIRGRQ